MAINFKKTNSFFLTKYKELKNKIKNLRNTNMEVGLCHYYMNNIFDAKIRFNLILKFNKNDIEAFYNLGRCFLKSRNPQKALDIFKNTMNDFAMSKYYYNKIIDEPIDSIPEQIIYEMVHSRALYKIYHNYQDVHLEKLIISMIYKHLNTKNAIEILHLYCCNGSIGLAIKRRGIDCKIYGSDISDAAVECCANVKLSNVSVYDEVFLKNFHSILVVDYSRYNLVICMEYASYEKDLNKTVQQFTKTISEGAILIISFFNSLNNDCELDEIMDCFCFSKKYIELTMNKNDFDVLEYYNSKNNLYINNNSTIYVVKKRMHK